MFVTESLWKQAAQQTGLTTYCSLRGRQQIYDQREASGILTIMMHSRIRLAIWNMKSLLQQLSSLVLFHDLHIHLSFCKPFILPCFVGFFPFLLIFHHYSSLQLGNILLDSTSYFTLLYYRPEVLTNLKGAQRKFSMSQRSIYCSRSSHKP